jgi:hypothetical protein
MKILFSEKNWIGLITKIDSLINQSPINQSLFNSNRFRQIPWLVHVFTEHDGNVVGK